MWDRVHLGVVQGVFRRVSVGIRGYLGCVLYLKRLRLS